MSDSKHAQDLDQLIESNPGVDRGLLDKAQDAVRTLREAGLTRPSYSIDSPYERRPAERPVSHAEDDDERPLVRQH